MIKREDIDEVRQRTDLKEIVDPHVTLKRAGIGSFKGLCPFHDERTPSFVVRPQVGRYHCFGCSKSGDAYSFVQEIEHLSFFEAVEKLAARLNYPLHYEQGGRAGSGEEQGLRQRMLEAHKIAAAYFQEHLLAPEAVEARHFLWERKFSKSDAEHFGVGYAPRGWDLLLQYLASRGFSHEELKSSGMFSSKGQGLYDRFRGRIIWPIRDITAAVIGFGARRLYDDDQGPKYLNTPETTLYKKSQVLYGIDVARKHIGLEKQLVVVEGYTDVMAAHCAGITTAVASCGTAFGEGHVRLARRLLADSDNAEVIFTFDGDAAGQKAALQAFKEDDKFLAQTFVAIEQTGKDPCELRVDSGNSAVVDLIKSRRPLFEFVLKTTIAGYDLTTIEGRTTAVRATAPILADIKDPGIRSEYIRDVSMRIGVPLEQTRQAVSHEAVRKKKVFAQIRRKDPSGESTGVPPHISGQRNSNHGVTVAEKSYPLPNIKNPRVRRERDILEVVVQLPEELAAEAIFERFKCVDFIDPAYAQVAQAVAVARTQGKMPQDKAVTWVQFIKDGVLPSLSSLVDELAVRQLPIIARENIGMTFEAATHKYARDILKRFFIEDITHKQEEKMRQLQRIVLSDSATDEQIKGVNEDLLTLERERRALESI